MSIEQVKEQVDHKTGKVRYILETKVDKVENKGNLGWFVLLQGIPDWIFLSDEQPDLKPNDRVILSLKKK